MLSLVTMIMVVTPATMTTAIIVLITGVMDEFEVTPDLFIDMIRGSYPVQSKEFSDDELRKKYYSLSKRARDKIKRDVQAYLRKTQNIGIDRENIVFTGL